MTPTRTRQQTGRLEHSASDHPAVDDQPPDDQSPDGGSPIDGSLTGVVRRRHSARGPYDPDRRVSAEQLGCILEAARWAPTAHNMQNYEVVAVDDPERLRLIGAIATEPSFEFVRENYAQLSFSEEELRRKGTGLLASMFPEEWRVPEPDLAAVTAAGRGTLGESIDGAPLVLVVVHDVTRRAPASEGDVLGMISLGCVLQNMWLTAEELGLGMQVISALSGVTVEPELRRILGLPSQLKVAFGVRLGYPLARATAPVRVRREVDRFTHHNTYRRTPRRG